MQELQKLLLSAIEQADTMKPLEFSLLTTWSEYRYYKNRYRYYKLLTKSLQSSANHIFKSYCKDIVLQKANFTKLLAYRQIMNAAEFYQQEFQTIFDMLTEYEEYLFDDNIFNFISAILGEQRSLTNFKN